MDPAQPGQPQEGPDLQNEPQGGPAVPNQHQHEPDGGGGDVNDDNDDLATPGTPGSSRPTLEPGENYRIIQGRQARSKLVIHDRYTYVLDRADRKDGLKFYMRCKFRSCPGRAIIRNNKLKRRPDDGTDHHTCVRSEAAGYGSIMRQEVLNRMKQRAMLEASSYYVSECGVFYLAYNA